MTEDEAGFVASWPQKSETADVVACALPSLAWEEGATGCLRLCRRSTTRRVLAFTTSEAPDETPIDRPPSPMG